MNEVDVYAWNRTPPKAAEMVQSLQDTGYLFVPVARKPVHNALESVTHLSTLADDELTRLVWADADEFGSLGWEKRVLAGGVRRDMLNVTGGLIADDKQWAGSERQRFREVCIAAHCELLTILTHTIDAQLPLDSPTAQLIDREVSTLRMLWYIGVEAPDTCLYPTPPHTDLGVVTALVQDSGGGLEVDIDGGWHRLPVLDGHALVAMGDLLEVITQGRLKSRQHRVAARSRLESNGGTRVSLVLFAHPTADFELAKTMPNPQWKTAGDYLNYRLAHKGKRN